MAFTSTDKRKKLVAAHELEKTQLKENFEQMQLCLQDQVDTLSFQNQSLKAKAKLFEEALNKGNEEQVKMAEAPYLLLEDLRSLIHVLELKNNQIHEQDRKIMELEEQVEKTVILEKRLSVLQQQNEDLRARIEQKTILTRQLSDGRASLIERMDKEMRENKRLKWKKEELLWKLQGGDS